MILCPVVTEKKEFEDYYTFVNRSLYDQIWARAKSLAGLKVSYLSATAKGGGVVELLRSVVPLLNDVGIQTSWYVPLAPEEFFKVTKKIHNLLQGQPGRLTKKEQALYFRQNQLFAQAMKEIETDVWIIYDPQPAGVVLYYNFHPMIWRCHLDTSFSNPRIWDFFSFLKNYDKRIFSLKEYVNPYLNGEKTVIFSPTIDPLSPKNWPIDPTLADIYLSSLGVDPDRPIITQVSRFDPWKDPLGVIEAYRLAKRQFPHLQLILTGETADDDPESERILAEVQKAAGEDPDIHLWADKKRNDLKINAIQVASDIILQKSIREGFGLTVTEAMWKEKVVIGGNCGGIKFQIKDGVNGFLVKTPREAAERIIEILKDPKIADKMGKKARQSVRKNFLMPHLLNNYLELLEEFLPATRLKKLPVQPILPTRFDTRQAGQPLRASPLSQIRQFQVGA